MPQLLSSGCLSKAIVANKKPHNITWCQEGDYKHLHEKQNLEIMAWTIPKKITHSRVKEGKRIF